MKLLTKLINNKLAKNQSIRQFVKYGIVGVIGLIIDMGLYYLLVSKFAVHYSFNNILHSLLNGILSVSMLDILVSNLIGNVLAVINNFILNSYFTFKVTDDKLKRFLSFAGVAMLGIILSSVLLTLFIDVMGINELLAKAFAVLIVACIQFFVNKFFTFKEKAQNGF